MKKTRARFLSLLLSVCMMVSLLPTVAFAADEITITQHPANATYTQGDTATPLSAVATVVGGETLTYQWQKAIATDAQSDYISGATESTYTPPTDVVGAMYYRCEVRASGGSGVNSEYACITVNAPSETERTVTDATELKTALERTAPLTIHVMADIALSEAVTVGGNHTLDIGSGFTVSTNEYQLTIPVEKQLDLTGGGTLRSNNTAGTGILIAGQLYVQAGSKLSISNHGENTIGVGVGMGGTAGALSSQDATITIANSGEGSTGIAGGSGTDTDVLNLSGGSLTVENTGGYGVSGVKMAAFEGCQVTVANSGSAVAGLSAIDMDVQKSQLTIRNTAGDGIVTTGEAIIVSDASSLSIENTGDSYGMRIASGKKLEIRSACILSIANGGRLSVDVAGTLVGSGNGKLTLAQGARLDNASGRFSDRGTICTAVDMVIVAAETAQPSAEGLSAGDYVWSATLFAKTDTPTVTDITINEANFPDANFRSWVLAQSYGTDGKLTPAEIVTITTISVSDKSIVSLQGIEHFTALTTLSCSGNQLTSLDVSKLTNLGRLFCENNQLTTLGTLPSGLNGLQCKQNRLTGLDVTGLNLTNLNCSYNHMTSEAAVVGFNKTWNDPFIFAPQHASDFKAVTDIVDVPAQMTVGTPLTLTGTVLPTDATNQTIVWSVPSGNSYGAVVSDGVLTATKAGTIRVTATITNGEAANKDYSKDYFITINAGGGITTHTITVTNGTASPTTAAQSATVTLTANAALSGQQFNEWTISPAVTFADGTSATDAIAKFTMPDEAVTATAVYEDIPSSTDILINEANFPDANFRSWLQLPQNINGAGADGKLTVIEIAAITRINVSAQGIASLKGVEYFTALTELQCSDNRFTDLGTLPTGLTELCCDNNQLTSLGTLPTGLTKLCCDNNQLTSLGTLPTGLTELSCEQNRLTGLTITGLTLSYLNCGYNYMTDTAAVTGFIGTWDNNNFRFNPQHAPGFTAVTDIVGVPNQTTVGTPLALTGTVVPADATNQEIAWSVYSASSGKATISNGVLTANAPGYIAIWATVSKGLSANDDYHKSFNIWVNAGGSTTTDAQTPIITRQPQSATVTVGQSVTLSVAASVSDGGTLSYEWRSGSNPNLGGSVIPNATGTTCTPSTTEVGTMYYWCIVTNSNNSASGNKTARIYSNQVAVTVQSGGSGGGGSSSGGDTSTPTITTPPATIENPNPPTEVTTTVKPTVSGDTVSATVSEKAVDNAIAKAQAEVKKNGTAENGIVVEIKVDTKNTKATDITTNLPKASVDALVKAGTKELRITSEIADISLDLDTLKEIQKQVEADITVSAKRVDNSTLSDEANKIVGNRPVYDLSITGSNGKKNTDFGNGKVCVSIPYTLGANENAANVVAYYIDSNGNITEMPNSVYDPVTQTLSFVTDHFSKFAVGYKAINVRFIDITNHWAKNSIEFVAARGLLSGTGEGKFSPNTSMTRGMFVTALGRLAGANVSSYKTSSFTDVKAGSYYLGYIEWASKNGIVNGTGNSAFAPDQAISREQMAVIMQNYAKAIGFELPKAHAENIFADNAKISSYTAAAVKQMQMAGVLSGKNGNLFDPQGTATRAEVSAVLKRFVELAISTDSAEGWAQSDSGKWMYYENSKAVTGKKDIDGTTYTFDQYGVTSDVPKNRKYTTYVVQKGDSFWRIAHNVGCTMTELEQLNNKSRFSLIHPGDELIVPEK